MKNYQSLTLIITLLLLSSLLSKTVQAANECKIKYQYNYDSGGKIKRTTKYLSLNLGQTKTVNRSRIDYVKNIRDPKIKLYNRNLLTNAKYTYDLTKNAQDPITGLHLINVKLEKVKCIKPASSSATNTPFDMVAKQMKAAGKSAGQVAAHLKNQLGQSNEQVAKWLKMAGYSGAQVAAALRSSFNISAGQAAKILKQVFNTTSTRIAEWLKQAGYSMDQITQALKQYLGVKHKEAATILKNVFRASTRSIANALKYAGYTLIQVASALENIDETAENVAKTLKDIFNATAKKAAQALKAAGYTAAQIAKALQSAYGTTAAKIKPILVAIGYSVSQAATAVKSQKNKYDDRNIVVDTINEKNMPNAMVTIVINKGSNKGYLRLTGEGVGFITGVRGLPIRSAKTRDKKSDIMSIFRNFPLNSSSSGTYLLMDLEFLHRAGSWTGATSGTGHLLTEKGRKLTNGQFRWKITEAAQATCPKGQTRVRGICK